MELFSLTFIFIFLPISMGIYYITPNKHKPLCLLLLSITYYLITPNGNILLIILSLFTDYTLALQIQANRKQKLISSLLVSIGVIKGLWLFIYFSIAKGSGTITPFGVLVVSLLGISYLIDVYKGEMKAETNLISYGVYGMFFPKLYYGPFIQYRDIKYQLESITPSLTGISRGIVIFIAALAKKIIIADNISLLYVELSQIDRAYFSVLTGWVLMISFAFSLYFNLSAYYDMAVALGYMFSIKLPNSFYYPFQARSLDEFFARFNITINGFVRKYVYVELGEKNNGPISASLNMLLVCMLISLWYGISINNLIWGIYLATFIILEQYLFSKIFKHIPLFICRLITFGITMLSFAIPAGKSLGESLFFIRTMFGLSTTSLFDTSTLYLLTSNIVLIPLCFILCTSIFSSINKFCTKNYPTLWETTSVIINIILLTISIAFMIP